MVSDIRPSEMRSMAYQCPRCGQDVSRASSPAAAVAGGLVGSLLYGALGLFECRQCGSIAEEEFPPEVRKQMMVGSIGMVAVAVTLFAIVVVVLIALNSMP